MGRSLFGNAVTAPVLTLSKTMGSLSSVIKDSSTTSDYETLPNGERIAFNTDGFNFQNLFARNAVNEQNITYSRHGVIQDPLSDYTYVQAYVFSGTYYGIVYDADLNVVYSAATASLVGTSMFCVRIYGGNLYFFSSAASSLIVTKVSLPSGATSTYTYSPPSGGNWSGAYGSSRVFNWPINDKFWVLFNQGSNGAPYQSLMVTFDIPSNTFALFGSITGTSSTGLGSTHAMHVKADGSAVSVAGQNLNNQYGVARFTSSASAFGTFTTNHWVYTGASNIFCNSNQHLCAVTTDAVVDVSYGGNTTSSNYKCGVPHLQGGDTAVQVADITATGIGYYPFTGVYPSPSLSARGRLFVSYQNTTGLYPVSRSGNSLVIGSRINSAYPTNGSWGAVQSKLADPIVVPGISVSNDNTASQAYLYAVALHLGGASASQYSYVYSYNGAGINSYGGNYAAGAIATTFVTSTGRFWSLSSYRTTSGTLAATPIKSSIPVFIPSATKAYNVAVIGGGGASSGAHGTSSTFAGIAAAAGSNRTGFVAGSTVITSGPTRGTGGTGYGADAWGQGEDTGTAGTYGGGSGYVATATLTLTAGTPYVYVVGFGPQYGKQGAILLSEV